MLRYLLYVIKVFYTLYFGKGIDMKLLIATIILSVFCVGCGSDSGETPSNTSPLPPNKDESTYNLTLTGTFSGLNLKNSNINVYGFNGGEQGALLGSTMLNLNGEYETNITVSNTSSMLMICTSGGDYEEVVSNERIELSNSDQFCTLSKIKATNTQRINISPLTNLATGLAIHNINQGVNFEVAAEAANTAISTIYGFNINLIITRLLTSDSIFSQDEIKSVLLSIGVSNLTLEISNDAGFSSHTNSYSSLSYYKAAYKDIVFDGMLNGKGQAFPAGPVVDIGLGGALFNGGTYSSYIARSAIRYLGSENNKSSFGISEALDSQAKLAESVNPIFDENIEDINKDGLDSSPPIFTFISINEEDLLDGTETIEIQTEDDLGIESVEFYINDILKSKMNGNDISFDVNTLELNDGIYSFKFYVIDFLGNATTQDFLVTVKNSNSYLELSSAVLTNQSNYILTGNTISEYPVSRIEINGVEVANVGNTINTLIELTEGDNLINYLIHTTNGIVHSGSLTVYLDTQSPSINPTHINSSYSVNYKLPNNSVMMSPLTFSSLGNPFYIDQYHISLSGISATLANLISINQPFVRFDFEDSDNGHGIFTERNNLILSYKYFQAGTLISENAISIQSNEIPIIPISSEYLASGWELFNGTHMLQITVADEAGNSNVEEFYFTSYLSNPAVDTNLIAHGDGSIFISGNDLTGFDNIVFEVNGMVYEPNSVTDLNFLLNPQLLSHGNNFGIIKAYKNGVIGFTQRVDFVIDKTAPEITLDPVIFTNSESPILSGLATDLESTITSLEVDGNAVNYNPFNDNFSYSFGAISDGIYSYTVTASNDSGLTNSIPGSIYKDTLVPRRALLYPTDPDYMVYYQSNPANAPTLDIFDFNDGTSVFYLKPENTSLNGLSPTLENLKNGKFIFISCHYSDRYSSGAETSPNELEVTYSYNIDFGENIISNQSLQIIDGIFILPVTVDYLSNNLISNSGPNILHGITISVKDKAGNVDLREYYFRINYDPSSQY